MTELAFMPDHNTQHHDAWSCFECGDTGDGGAVGYARHHRDHHDPRRTQVSNTTQANITTSTDRIAHEIAAGRRKAHAKHGDTSIEGSGNAFEFLAILVEEVGEAAEALNEYRHDPAYPIAERLRAELIDVATVAVAWVAAIDASEEAA